MAQQIEFNNANTIRAYFEKVRELVKSGEQYPVDLDAVWQLAFTTKGNALKALKKREFIEGIHYQVFIQMDKNPKGGRPEECYKLSTACVEFLIASRVPAVFEIYRLVFHQVVDQLQQLPANQDELILMLAQRNVELAKRLRNIENQFGEFVLIQNNALSRIKELPASGETVPAIKTEVQVRTLVDAYVLAKNIPHEQVWRFLYSELNYRYAINVSLFKLKLGESKLQAIKRHGHIDKLYALASTILKLVPAAV